tara:strand:- start:1223 stop:2401 length:1179 start_codon:yes stop_codon:yes gene_type:complete
MSQLKVNTIRHTGASSDAITLASDGTATAKITNNLSNRNLIINGAMNVAQRGTSDTSTGYYTTVDRWQCTVNGLEENVTRSQESLSSSDTGPYEKGFRNAWKFVNGNQTGGADAGGYIIPQYLIEAQNIANSGWNYKSASSYITLSFWVKSSVAQTFYGFFRTLDGTGQAYSFSYALSANTWTKVTKKIPGNSNIDINDDNGTGLALYLPLFLGTDRTNSGNVEDTWAAYSGSNRTKPSTTTWYTTNDSTWHLTGVQLEVGDVATDFEHRSYDYELRRCQRYFWGWKDPNPKIGFCNGFQRTSDMMMANLRHPVEMRASPTLTTSTDAGDFAMVWLNSGGDVNASGITTPGGTYDRRFTYPIAATLGSGSIGSAAVGVIIETDGTLQFSAEL